MLTVLRAEWSVPVNGFTTISGVAHGAGSRVAVGSVGRLIMDQFKKSYKEANPKAKGIAQVAKDGGDK
ncbi:hypothetical protein SUGI_1075810 [Cryptomeria japonica]|nr:hypothetical protein SUGI_1075810 [Cryptomeria japonica]